MCKDNIPKKDGSWQKMLAHKIILCWGQEKYRKTITYNSANITTFNTAPGNKRERGQTIPKTFKAFIKSVVTDDEDDSDTDGGANKDNSV